MAQLWPFLWGWVRPSTHPTLSIACIYRIPPWRGMLACLLAYKQFLPRPLQGYSAAAAASSFLVASSRPLCPCNISLRHWPQQSAFVLKSSHWSWFPFLFLSPSVFCLDVWLPIPFPSRPKMVPYQNMMHFITNSIMPSACQQDFAQWKEKQGWKACPGHRLTCDCINAKEKSYSRRLLLYERALLFYFLSIQMLWCLTFLDVDFLAQYK